MYRVSAQGVDERMINVYYYYYYILISKIYNDLDMRSLFIYKIKTFICRCVVVFPTRLQFVQQLFVI